VIGWLLDAVHAGHPDVTIKITSGARLRRVVDRFGPGATPRRPRQVGGAVHEQPQAAAPQRHRRPNRTRYQPGIAGDGEAALRSWPGLESHVIEGYRSTQPLIPCAVSGCRMNRCRHQFLPRHHASAS